MTIVMSTTDILITLLAGGLLGISFSLITFKFLTCKEIERERFIASTKIYSELLLKKRDRQYVYSDVARKVINQVHASILLQESKKAPQIT